MKYLKSGLALAALSIGLTTTVLANNSCSPNYYKAENTSSKKVAIQCFACQKKQWKKLRWSAQSSPTSSNNKSSKPTVQFPSSNIQSPACEALFRKGSSETGHTKSISCKWNKNTKKLIANTCIVKYFSS